MQLVIVESPTKAKKIGTILGPQYRVMPSFGHIRDLPLGDLGESVHIEGDKIWATYVGIEKSSKAVADIKRVAKTAEIIYLASDPDREGEAIAWHLEEVLRAKRKCKRVKFHALTPEGIRAGIQQAGAIDYDLVNAQETRRILDRCVGWITSPLVTRGLNLDKASAGRVQSVGLRFVVDREREIQNFTKKDYYVLQGLFEARPTQPKFTADIESYENIPVGTSWIDRGKAEHAAQRCRQALYRVAKLEKHTNDEKAPAPFITSTAQNKASQIHGFTPKRTMELLQALFEEGRITYHRTDSPFVIPEAIAGARTWIQDNLPKEYLPKEPNKYLAKGGAQEAHEAIRPTHWNDEPKDSASDIEIMYGMIWRRFIASQMPASQSLISTMRLGAEDRGGSQFAIFIAKGRMRLFDGWKRIEKNDADTGNDEVSHDDKLLPVMQEKDPTTLLKLECDARATKPPTRFSQGTLVQALERNGIGRPSSYATILDKILERGYITENNKKLYASELGIAICEYLVSKFTDDFIEFGFTKRIESSLDAIAEGKLAWQPFLIATIKELSRKAQSAGLGYDPMRAKRE